MQRAARVVDTWGMSKKTKPTRSAAPVTPAPTLTQTAPAAFALVRTEIEAVPASDFAPINLDIARAARRGLAVSERLEPLLPALAKLPDLDYRLIERMPTYALAVLHTDELAAEGGGATAKLAVLLTEAVPLRELMLRGAETLALAGFVANERVVAIRRGQGHADTAADLQALGRLYRELWERVHDKVPITRLMVERAITLSAELNAALGIREIGEEDPLVDTHDPGHLRTQAFTLFARAYDECRRGVTYLRWHHGDALAVAPTLYTRQPRRAGVAGGLSEPEEGAEADGGIGVDENEREGEATAEPERGGGARTTGAAADEA